MIKFLDLYAQYKTIKEEIDAAIADVIANSAYIGGERVVAFEEAFASYMGVKFCSGVGNGTDALELAISALNLPNGSKIIVPANSFIATSEAVANCGFQVVFADVKDDYTVDVKSVKSVLDENVKALICVHLYGLPCDMDEIVSFCKENSLCLIEDSAQAHGAEFRGKRVGSFGSAGVFSFYPGKNLGAYGDAGATVSDDYEINKNIRMRANHGRVGKYDHEFEGRNSRMDGLQAAILSVKLKYLDGWLAKRAEIASVYLRELVDTPLILPKIHENRKHVWHLFVVRTKQRDALKEFLFKKGIESGVHYPIALPKLKAYSHVLQDTSDFFACKIDGELLSLPIGEHMSSGDAQVVCEAIKEFFKGER